MDVYALLADGRIVEIRPATPGDHDAIKAMYEAMTPDDIYLRFFNYSRLSAEHEARRMCDGTASGRVALLALNDGAVVGCASYDMAGDTAEVAFAVAEGMHHKGIATLLLEHLVSIARREHVEAFTAQTLEYNTPMLHVFADAGLPVRRHLSDGVVEVTIPLPRDDSRTELGSYLEKVARRERAADAASLRHVFAPTSVAVIGASRETRTVGRAILDNIRTAGYTGRLYAVSPRDRQIGGVHCVPTVGSLPEAPELAVIAVPAAAVLDVAEDCGKLGTKALVVTASGLDAGTSADLLATCRRHGMRLIGPDSSGIAVPALGLDATFAATHLDTGGAGLIAQSGGLGLAMAERLSRLGIGISTFASVGDKLDVSGNDLLMWWDQDEATKLAVLYLDSFGNPRKFARIARRAGQKMPILTVRPEHDPKALALFEQAGIITAPGSGELIETAALLATQPIPAGRTVAIVSNTSGAGTLASRACAGLGLTVHRPPGQARRKLRTLISTPGSVTGPVYTTPEISPDGFRQVMELLAADKHVDAIIALVLPTGATGDLVTAIKQARISVPVAAVVLDQPESVRLLDGRVPAYADPEAAAAAMARAVRYGAGRREPRGVMPGLDGINPARSHDIIRRYLHQHTTADGAWLPPGETTDLLTCYGIDPEKAYGGAGELSVRVTDDHVFGPLIMLESGDENAARFALLTDADADALVESVHGGAGLRELLLRVSRLADDLPEVIEMELKPAQVRIRVAPYVAQDPFLRKLR